MCGRYTLRDPARIAAMCAQVFGGSSWQFPQRYNAAREQLLPAVAALQGGTPAGHMMKWGFVPAGDDPTRPKVSAMHAKIEEAAANPKFAEAVELRRCLIPADGFFEWKRVDADAKQPHYFQLNEGRPFFFAGIFQDARAGRPECFAIITTRANALLKPVHQRMPVILMPEGAADWLASGALESSRASQLRAPFPADKMQSWPVSRWVNRRRNDSPACIAPG